MRWDNLRMDTADDEQHALPGYRDPAVIRTFDAPEALDTRFYEVRAKSALNRVPEKSRMPFRWTINPYRGCSHACSYCLLGDTRILMADGRTKAIADLRVGDEVYGTVKRGSYRRYEATRILDHWSTTKPAFRVTLEDGTELVTSGDHRFLTERGWKHVTGAEHGALRRPHLTLNNALMGTGAFASAPPASTDYRRGYLCGLIRGDGQLGDVHRFRLALTDFEALRRARGYLFEAGIETDESAFSVAVGGTRPMRAIRAQSRARVDAIRELIRWPWSPPPDWCKGFLAGIFDAEGSCGQGVLRIANSDRAMIERTVDCLRLLGFDHVVDVRRTGASTIRIRGGLHERLRFFHTVEPAITRKRTIDGLALKSDARLGVVAIEPLGADLPLYDITTGTGDFIANGVVSHNCFARPTHTYLDFDADRDFEKEIVVKVNAPEVLRAELARPSWKGEHIAMGTNTDPYQWVEGRYRLMEGIWEALRDAANPGSILTKSPLVLRDLPLLLQLAERAEVSAAFSVPTIDEKAWRATEPHTPHPRKRLEAIGELNRAGIPTGVLVAPLIPGVNDDPRQIEEIVELATEAGATHIGGIALHLRGEVRGIFFDWLRAHRPDLVPRYERLYRRGAYAPTAERNRLNELVADARKKADAKHPRQRAPAIPRFRRSAADPGPRESEARPRPGTPVQRALF